MKIGILNNQTGGWAFSAIATMLSNALGIDIVEEPVDYNYVLSWEPIKEITGKTFIPLNSILVAADKRKIAKLFNSYHVPSPKTVLCETLNQVKNILEDNSSEWVLKYPTGCGANGHRMIKNLNDIPNNWLKPYIIQQFIRLEEPQVFRFYCVDADLFGFNVRKFPPGIKKSPWVAHACGAKYQFGEKPPTKAIVAAQAALQATKLWTSFGCVDLIKDDLDNWYVLEVGTDGIFTYVDRDFDNPDLLDEMNMRIAKAFWKQVGTPPWSSKSWKYKTV